MDLIEDFETWVHNRRHHTSAAQAAVTTTKGTTMSLSGDFQAITSHVGSIVSKAEVLLANPETETVIDDVAALLGLNLPPNVLSEALGGLRALKLAYSAATQTGQQPVQQAPAQ